MDNAMVLDVLDVDAVTTLHKIAIEVLATTQGRRLVLF